VARRKNDFQEADKIKLLLWCDRHCCLCGKACGTDIEIAHIEAKEPGVIDNAIPLCYDCHARIGHYNREHPRGTRYKGEELKARRDQLYEQYTRALVPPIDCQIAPRPPHDPDLVGFTLAHMGNSLPVKVRVMVNIFREEQDFGCPVGGKLYDGRRLWNLNPRRTFSGHFDLPVPARTAPGTLEARVTITVFDQYGKDHPRLPESWIYDPKQKSWYAHPDPRP
jgi:hypothetical protein